MSIHSEFKPKYNSAIDEKMFQCTGQGGILLIFTIAGYFKTWWSWSSALK